jgi:hypothetical protein
MGEAGAGEEAGGVNLYMFRDAMLKLLLAEELPYAKLIDILRNQGAYSMSVR